MFHTYAKISKSIGILRKICRLLPIDTRIQLYNSLILPYLNYCILIWGNAGITVLDRPIKLQKRAIRALTLSPYLAHTVPLFRHCNILPFSSLYTYACSLFVYKNVNSMYPECFSNEFNARIRGPVQHRTRYLRFQIPNFRTTFGQKSLTYQYCKLYNELLSPLELSAIPISQFKRTVRHLLM